MSTPSWSSDDIGSGHAFGDSAYPGIVRSRTMIVVLDTIAAVELIPEDGIHLLPADVGYLRLSTSTNGTLSRPV